MDQNDTELEVDAPTSLAEEVEVLDIDDDLDTGMHRVNVCPTPL